MAVPAQLAAFAHREFKVVIGRVGGCFVARAWNRSRKHVAEVKGSARADVEAEMRCHLNAISENYIGFNGAINLFRRAFPGGFGCPYYAFREREYKDARARLVADALDEERLRRLMEQDRHREVAKLALQTLEMKSGDLCPWQEQNTLKKALGRTGVVKPFAEGLHHLLYGDFDAALGSLAALLKPHDAAKWTLLTFWPFFRFPGRQMFMKPTVVQDCAVRLGYELHYEPTPNQKTYHSLLGLAAFVREGIGALQPRTTSTCSPSSTRSARKATSATQKRIESVAKPYANP